VSKEIKPEQIGWKIKGQLLTFRGHPEHPIEYARFTAGSGRQPPHEIEIAFRMDKTGFGNYEIVLWPAREGGYEISSLSVQGADRMYNHILGTEMTLSPGEMRPLLTFLRDQLKTLHSGPELEKHPNKAEARMIGMALRNRILMIENELKKSSG